MLFIGLISLFAFDMFDGNAPIGEKFLGFLIHLIPTYVLLALLFLAWKRPLLGGILFMLAGSSYFLFAREQHWVAYLIVAGTPILIGILFLAEYLLVMKKKALV